MHMCVVRASGLLDVCRRQHKTSGLTGLNTSKYVRTHKGLIGALGTTFVKANYIFCFALSLLTTG